MKMRIPALISLLLLVCSLSAQKQNIHYRTVTDSSLALHYLVFSGDSQCRLILPVTTSAQAMLVGHREFDIQYQIVDDTLSFFDLPTDVSSPIMDQIREGQFVKKENNTLYDCVSGYTYLDKQRVSTRHHLYVLDGEPVMQRIGKSTNGIIKTSPRQRYKIRRFVKKNVDDIATIEVLKGQMAFEAYGAEGMNGVIKIVLKE